MQMHLLFGVARNCLCIHQRHERPGFGGPWYKLSKREEILKKPSCQVAWSF